MRTPTSTRVRAALRRAAARAILAPSVHNTQPWIFHLYGGVLEIYADPSRQLLTLDPTRRQLTISCGCALFNARVAVTADNIGIRVDRMPDPFDSNLLARISAADEPFEVVDPIAAYDTVLESRQTNRRRFADDDVPGEAVAALQEAARAEDAHLFEVRNYDHRFIVARLSRRADELQMLNPAYRAEIRAWTTDDPRRRDGVPAMAVPHVDANTRDEVPIRDFDSRGAGWLPSDTRSTSRQCLVILGTDSDNPRSWIRAGEALERVLLEVTRRGFVASPLTQVVEIPETRSALRRELGLVMNPHVLLRVGRAPLTPAAPRRRLPEVLFEQS